MVTAHFELQNACLEINNEIILENITLKIQNHCLTHISGENGSGKTCLISALLRLYKLRAGQCRSSFDKKILCYIPAHTYFYDTEHVRTVLFFLSKLYNCTINSLKAIMKSLHLDYDIIKFKKMNELSSGMRQKLHILPLFLEHHDIYFLDEIIQNLDSQAVQIVQIRLDELLKKEKTIVIIDHNHQFINSLTAPRKESYICKNKKILKHSDYASLHF